MHVSLVGLVYMLLGLSMIGWYFLVDMLWAKVPR